MPEATKANVKGNVFDGLHEQQPVDDPGVMVPILADYFDQLRWRTLPTYFGVRLDAALRPVEGELERAAREEVAMIQVDPTSWSAPDDPVLSQIGRHWVRCSVDAQINHTRSTFSAL